MPKNVPTIESQVHSESIVTDCAAPPKEASSENAGTPEERNALCMTVYPYHRNVTCTRPQVDISGLLIRQSQPRSSLAILIYVVGNKVQEVWSW